VTRAQHEVVRMFLLLFVMLAVARLCHSGILWAEEGLPLAAARQILDGKVLYRDIWFDKPPLLAYLYLAWGAAAGWPLRLAGALYDLLACWLAFGAARRLWGEREGRIAASLLAFFLIFGVPSAVTPLAADLLTLAPHLAAIALAVSGRPFGAGALAGVAFLINPKALLILLACAVWTPAGSLAIAGGFAAACAVAAAAMASAGALGPCIDQVWHWGRLYATSTFVANPVRNAVLRTLNWAGFHVALLAATGVALRAEKRRLVWALWLALGIVAAAAGMRFFPRYFFQLLPVLVLLAARGFALLPRRTALALGLLLAIPLVRFGPRYALLATGRSDAWADTAMDRDSRAAAGKVVHMAAQGDTLFVWGFRPELYAYTRLPAASLYLDSQPLTGVPADRHLFDSGPVDPDSARLRRAAVAGTAPTFILDGLGLYNPALAITQYEDLRPWLSNYREVARTAGTVVYQRVR
jgi:hypothetical protein